jgi:Domain of unknown function (DUF1906)
MNLFHPCVSRSDRVDRHGEDEKGSRQLSARAARWVVLGGAVAALVAGLSAPAQASGAPGALKTVTYLGYRFAVPAGWPVIRTTRTSTACVRFDRHAIYLGDPGQNQDCPSNLLGTTEAILVQPGAGHVPGASSAEDQAARRITAVSPGIEVTATYDTDRALVARILSSAGLPLPPSASRGPTVNRKSAAQQLAAPAAATATLPAGATSYTGEGFDACAAPSSAYMSAWKNSSPYGVVGIYIGGAERACAQPNLTASWVSQQAAAGWRFVPIYVGRQADAGQLTSPASQAAAAAEDAVTQASSLGFGPGSPIYYDMEAYPSSQKANALAFMSAWTTQLHAEGYKSAIYSSSSSGVTDLVGNFTRYAMPDVIWDALWNGQANTTDPVIPAADWAVGRRAHQFNGGANETYGGDTIDVDQDYLNVSLTPPPPANPGQPALVASSGAVADYVIRGRNLYTYYQTSPGGGFTGPKKLTTSGNLTGAPVAVQAANGLIWVCAETIRGAVEAFRQSAPGAAVGQPANLAGRIEGSPAAIATQRGTVAVYVVGVNGDLYTYYQTIAGGGFTGPKRLTTTGNLTGSPAAVQVANGILSVYARTTGGAVQAVWQNSVGGAVTKSADLGGHLAGSPAAVVTGADTIAVYAIGTHGQLYGSQQRKPGARFTGPTRLTTTGGLTGTPVAVPGSNGTVSVYARTTSGSVRSKWQSVAAGPFSGSAALGGHLAGDLGGLVADGPAGPAGGGGAVALYATGTNGRQYGDHQGTGPGSFTGWVVI